MTQGDVLVLDTGDRVVADGLYISGHNLVIDEASLTGESDPKKKSEEKPWLRSGTQVHPAVEEHFCLLPHMRGWRSPRPPCQPARHQGGHAGHTGDGGGRTNAGAGSGHR